MARKLFGRINIGNDRKHSSLGPNILIRPSSLSRNECKPPTVVVSRLSRWLYVIISARVYRRYQLVLCSILFKGTYQTHCWIQGNSFHTYIRAPRNLSSLAPCLPLTNKILAILAAKKSSNNQAATSTNLTWSICLVHIFLGSWSPGVVLIQDLLWNLL